METTKAIYCFTKIIHKGVRVNSQRNLLSVSCLYLFLCLFSSFKLSAQCGTMSFTSVLPVNPTILNCPNPNDGSITIVAIQAVSYSKDNGVTWQASAIFPNLTAGSYRLKIKNILNCEIAYVGNPVVLTAPTCLEICGDNIDNDGDGLKDCFDSDCGVLNIPSVLSTNPTLFNCPNPNDGTITVATLGVGYEYSKNNGSTWQASPIFTGLTEGSYNIKARNTITGCEVSYASNPVVLTKPLCIEICGDNIDNDGDGNADCADSDCGILSIATVLSTNPTLLNCPTPNDGTITVVSLGIIYEYSKDNGSTWQLSPIFTGLTEGSYNIKARNTITG